MSGARRGLRALITRATHATRARDHARALRARLRRCADPVRAAHHRLAADAPKEQFSASARATFKRRFVGDGATRFVGTAGNCTGAWRHRGRARTARVGGRDAARDVVHVSRRVRAGRERRRAPFRSRARTPRRARHRTSRLRPGEPGRERRRARHGDGPRDGARARRGAAPSARRSWRCSPTAKRVGPARRRRLRSRSSARWHGSSDGQRRRSRQPRPVAACSRRAAEIAWLVVARWRSISNGR